MKMAVCQRHLFFFYFSSGNDMLLLNQRINGFVPWNTTVLRGDRYLQSLVVHKFAG